MKKNSTGLKNKKDQKIEYCTECGEALTDYCFSDDVKDLEALKSHHENCKTTKKFKGDVCSKLFIATPVQIDNDRRK
ncbi:MAG: hypothetical protein HY964_00260 [Ignavibacteriales bacterium]|nr:hypothetical protein [Ignavibacteriales bacterium]